LDSTKHRTLAGVPDILELAQRIRWLRQCLRMSQEEFAEHAGIGYKFYQQIESGRKKHIWLDTLERIADGFGVELWELLAPTPPPTLHPADYPKTVTPASTWALAEELKNAPARRMQKSRRKRQRRKRGS
jgi:transcriptional regulator with XRE-family HTH domain